jgi:hypothetical protein
MADRTTVVVRYAHKHRGKMASFDAGEPHLTEEHGLYTEGEWNEVDPDFFINGCLPSEFPMEGCVMQATGISPSVFASIGDSFEEHPSDTSGVPIVRCDRTGLKLGDLRSVAAYWAVWERVRASFKESTGG